MDSKTLHVLEYDKIRVRLKGFCDFSALISCRELKKSLERKTDEYPRLSQIAVALPETFGIVDAITRILSERGEVLDSASPKLASLRREIRIAHDRLMSRLQRYLTESGNKLQEPIITQRDGRYVIPLRLSLIHISEPTRLLSIS